MKNVFDAIEKLQIALNQEILNRKKLNQELEEFTIRLEQNLQEFKGKIDGI